MNPQTKRLNLNLYKQMMHMRRYISAVQKTQTAPPDIAFLCCQIFQTIALHIRCDTLGCTIRCSNLPARSCFISLKHYIYCSWVFMLIKSLWRFLIYLSSKHNGLWINDWNVESVERLKTWGLLELIRKLIKMNCSSFFFLNSKWFNKVRQIFVLV